MDYGTIEGRPAAGDGTGWIQTFTGRKVFPLQLRPEDVNLFDIAHSLARQCRFAGHTRQHYSVAQHSLLVAEQLPPGLRLWGLLHDASEAYLTDIPRPLKRLPEFAFYREAEARAMLAICERFGLDPVEPACVKEADRLLLVTEARDFMAPLHDDWEYQPKNGYAALAGSLTLREHGVTQDMAEKRFLNAFHNYSND